MADAIYTIYLVNQSGMPQTFWCFLAPPPGLANDPEVFASSSSSLTVSPNDPGVAAFAIPVQFVVGAGASNDAVGLDVEIFSDVTRDAALEQTFDANYVTAPPNEGPMLALASASSPPGTISIVSNAFNQEQNEANGWFGNMSFGIQTDTGYIGMTWSPSPQIRRTLTPNLTFCVTAGEYDSNVLASWPDMADDGILIPAPESFSDFACTVTFTPMETWSVAPGAPAMEQVLTEGQGVQADIIRSVRWDSRTSELVVLTGTLTVATALVAKFTYFVLAGVTFTVISDVGPGTTTFAFEYTGNMNARAVMSLVVAGATVLLGGAE